VHKHTSPASGILLAWLLIINHPRVPPARAESARSLSGRL
jgi:hypothetical protein